MSRLVHATRWSAAVLVAALVPSCAPSCAPVGPAPTTTTTIRPVGQLTVTYDGAGPGVARIGLIGDSTLASIRVTDSYAPLRRWNYTYDAEACRRTITPSCAGADGYAPENGITVMHRLSGQLGRVLVIMLGANDPTSSFGAGIDAVVTEARAQGISSVIWLTVPEAADRDAILVQRAQQDGGYLRVADWASYVAGHPEWLYADGLHVNATGAPVLAQFIADQVARVLP